MIWSARVEPDIPAYPFWNAKLALKPFDASTYLASIISGLYADNIEAFGLFSPTTHISWPSTNNLINSESLSVLISTSSKVFSHSLTPDADNFATKATVLAGDWSSYVLPQI